MSRYRYTALVSPGNWPNIQYSSLVGCRNRWNTVCLIHSKLWAYCKCANRRGLSFFAQDKFWRFWRCIGEREGGFVAEYQARYVSFYWTLCRLIPSPDTNVSPRDDVNTAARTSRPANRQPLTRQPRVSTVGPATATSGRSASLNRVRSRSLTRKQQLVTLRSQKGLASMLAPSCFSLFCFWSRRISLGWPSPCSLSLLFGILSLLRICFKFFFSFRVIFVLHIMQVHLCGALPLSLS